MHCFMRCGLLMAAAFAAPNLPNLHSLPGIGAKPAVAQSENRQARELDKLFADLKQASAQEDADKITGRIWDIWMRRPKGPVSGKVWRRLVIHQLKRSAFQMRPRARWE